jgi:RimJ/RimL family protein N-acetyltransferase
MRMNVFDLRLETERLLLRPTAREDFDAWAGFMADEDAARFLGGVQPRPVAWRGFLSMAGAWAIQGFAMFSVIEKSSGRWVGRLGPWMPEGWPGTEVGWGLAREAWGKGYATEGAAAAIDWAFANLGWTEVIHTITPENVASRRVAERLGSRNLRSGQLPAPFEQVPIEIWGQSREEWLARRDGRAGSR